MKRTPKPITTQQKYQKPKQKQVVQTLPPLTPFHVPFAIEEPRDWDMGAEFAVGDQVIFRQRVKRTGERVATGIGWVWGKVTGFITSNGQPYVQVHVYELLQASARQAGHTFAYSFKQMEALGVVYRTAGAARSARSPA